MEGTEPIALTKDNQTLFFSVNKLELNNLILSFSSDIDIRVKQQEVDVVLESFSDKVIHVTIDYKKIKTTQKLMPGVMVVIHLKK